MPLWGWVMIGWVAVAIVLSLALARVFGRLGRRDTTVSEYLELMEFELWSKAPLTRAGTMAEHEEMIELAMSVAAPAPQTPGSRTTRRTTGRRLARR
jgi:hypothetical protein